MLTILVSVTSAEKEFFKLKLIKSYLRSTMSQQRLNKINYDNLIDNFTS